MNALFALSMTFLLVACSVAPTKAPTTMANPGTTDPTTGTASATGGAPNDATITRVVCKSAKEERVLEMHSRVDGCELLYTRAGNTRSIATSRLGDAACKAVRGKTQSNLERSGYRCE